MDLSVWVGVGLGGNCDVVVFLTELTSPYSLNTHLRWHTSDGTPQMAHLRWHTSESICVYSDHFAALHGYQVILHVLGADLCSCISSLNFSF